MLEEFVRGAGRHLVGLVEFYALFLARTPKRAPLAQSPGAGPASRQRGRSLRPVLRRNTLSVRGHPRGAQAERNTAANLMPAGAAMC
jgi:hypothetical protein